MNLNSWAIVGAVLLAFTGSAYPAEFPDHPIALVVPFAAGGQTDSLARIVGENLGRKLGQPVVVENRTGAGGAIGTERVARAEPDGYTIILVGPSNLITQPLLNSSVRYSIDQFAPIAMVSVAPMILVVNAKSGYHTLGELIAAGKQKRLTYGSSGTGSSMHLGVEWLLSLTGMAAVHVPFRGSSQSLPALLSGDIDFLIDPPITAYPLVEGGQLRALAVTALTPDERLAAIPTMAASGAPGYEQLIWNGLMAPAKTPKPVIDKLVSALRDIVADPVVVEQLSKAGVPAFYRGPQEFGEFLAQERDKYQKIIESAHITIDQK